MLLGSHLSIAGGVDRALLRAAEFGFRTMAMFVRGNVQWRAAALTPEMAARFRRTRRRLGIRYVVAHGMYLSNLAGRWAVRRKSIAVLGDELDRCRRLGIEMLVIHPGSRADTAAGLRLIATGLDAVLRASARGPKVLLETTAGSGHGIGGRFEHLAEIMARMRRRRVGVCLDTCHVFAAGYDIRTPAAYRRTMAEFDRVIGLNHLYAVHLNDSTGGTSGVCDDNVPIVQGLPVMGCSQEAGMIEFGYTPCCSLLPEGPGDLIPGGAVVAEARVYLDHPVSIPQRNK